MAERDPRVIGERIARLRHQRDLTQIELAAALGVSSSTVADWERGARYPRRKMGKIEQFFGQRVDYDEDGTPDTRPSSTAEEALDRAMAELEELRQRLRGSQGKGSNGDEGNGSTRRAV